MYLLVLTALFCLGMAAIWYAAPRTMTGDYQVTASTPEDGGTAAAARVNINTAGVSELDGLPELVKFGEALEAASLQTLNDGIMTKDLCGLAEGITPTAVDSEGFIKAIRTRLEAKLA